LPLGRPAGKGDYTGDLGKAIGGRKVKIGPSLLLVFSINGSFFQQERLDPICTFCNGLVS
jgi:hypothetical protein